MAQQRPLHEIADEIRSDWSKQKSGINYGAKPYLEAMSSMDKVTENFGYDSGKSIVLYFLSNATQWRGETIKAIGQKMRRLW